jgi:hypothetical protein
VNDELRVLRQALVPPRHGALYQNSAAFHSAIDTLARMLPVWVDGLALECSRLQADVAENVQLAMRGQVTPDIDVPRFLRND